MSTTIAWPPDAFDGPTSPQFPPGRGQPGLPTPVGDLLEGPSLSMLAASLCRRLGDAPGLETPAEVQAVRVGSVPVGSGIIGSGEDARQLLVRLPALEDDDVARLLLKRGGAAPSRHHPLPDGEIVREFGAVTKELRTRSCNIRISSRCFCRGSGPTCRSSRRTSTDRAERSIVRSSHSGASRTPKRRRGDRRMAADNRCSLGSDVPGRALLRAVGS